jgi:hypothetical protein
MRLAAVIGVSVLALGCAIANTPQQELAYARWVQCSSPDGQLERIDLDGRIVFRYSRPGGRQAVAQCLAEAGRTGPPLPAPLAVGPPGGP